jgi:hypothetical protein
MFNKCFTMDTGVIREPTANVIVMNLAQVPVDN